MAIHYALNDQHIVLITIAGPEPPNPADPDHFTWRRGAGGRRGLCRARRGGTAMGGFAVFAGKEAREILHTWRIWVLPGILLFFALTGPVLARFTPEIVGALAGDTPKGFVMPTPTYLDAYTQWIKNLSQIGLFALIIIYGSVISSETKSGTAVLVLTKPVSRTAFVIAKAAVHSAFLAILVVAGTLATWGLTAAVFKEAPGSALWSSALVWLVFGVLFITLMTLLSVLIGSAAAAAGAGLGAYALVSIAAIWKPLGTYSPAALTMAPASLASGKDVAVLWPVLTSLLLAALLVPLPAPPLLPRRLPSAPARHPRARRAGAGRPLCPLGRRRACPARVSLRG